MCGIRRPDTRFTSTKLRWSDGRLARPWAARRPGGDARLSTGKSSPKLEGGVPRDIVSPGVVQVIIQEDRWKQAELERPARLELLDDLPGAEVLFVGVGADEVEVELIG